MRAEAGHLPIQKPTEQETTIQEPNEPIQKPNGPIQKPSESRFRNQNSRFRNQVGRFRNQTRRFSNYDSETKTADSETKTADAEIKLYSETKLGDGCNGVEGRRSVGWGVGGNHGQGNNFPCGCKGFLKKEYVCTYSIWLNRVMAKIITLHVVAKGFYIHSSQNVFVYTAYG